MSERILEVKNSITQLKSLKYNYACLNLDSCLGDRKLVSKSLNTLNRELPHVSKLLVSRNTRRVVVMAYIPITKASKLRPALFIKKSIEGICSSIINNISETTAIAILSSNTGSSTLQIKDMIVKNNDKFLTFFSNLPRVDEEDEYLDDDVF